MIFGIKNGFKVVVDLVKSIYGDLHGNLNVAWLHDYTWFNLIFEIKYVIYIELDAI